MRSPFFKQRKLTKNRTQNYSSDQNHYRDVQTKKTKGYESHFFNKEN